MTIGVNRSLKLKQNNLPTGRLEKISHGVENVLRVLGLTVDRQMEGLNFQK